MHSNNCYYRSLSPRASDHRTFGELALSHHTPACVLAYAIDPVVSDGGFHLRYDGTVGVTLSHEPQLFAVNLVGSNGYPALTGHYLVNMLPQPDLPLVEEHFIASGRQVLLLVGVADVEPGDLLGVAHTTLIRVPLGAL